VKSPIWTALLATFLLMWAGSAANAHALQPGYLEINALSEKDFRIVWRKPDVEGAPMEIHARLPEGCAESGPPNASFDGQGWSATWITSCPEGLRGGEIVIAGLEDTRTDVLVRYETAPEEGRTERLTPTRPSFVVPTDPGAIDVLRSYVPLGIEHILGGIDHLLFVFALLLLIRDGWRLLGAITAFTVAHSITMAAATLGWVSLPGPPVEAVIALSIMFLASELLHRKDGTERLSERYPWSVSFSFGLLHGFGFAGALAEIGVPDTDIPLALLSFNLGVEIGQLLFVGCVVAAVYAARRLAPQMVAGIRAPHSVPLMLTAYAIGSVSAYWFIDRVGAFFA